MRTGFSPSYFSLTKEWAGSFFPRLTSQFCQQVFTCSFGRRGGGVISDEERYKKLAKVAGEGKNDVNNPHLFTQVIHT